MLIPFGVFSAAGGNGGAAAGAYELISTQILTGTAASVTFSSIPSTYKHLQVRMALRTDLASPSGDWIKATFNGITTTSYAYHVLFGGGSSVQSFGGGTSAPTLFAKSATAGSGTGVFASAIADILDYSASTKNKTSRVLSGVNPTSLNTDISLSSYLFNNTAAISTILFEPFTSANFVAGSRFSLYGVKG